MCSDNAPGCEDRDPEPHLQNPLPGSRKIHPHLLLAALSCPIAAEQVYAKRFTQDIIDTLGEKLNEIVLPIPKSKKAKQEIIQSVGSIISQRVSAREQQRSVLLKLARTDEDEVDTYGFFRRLK